MAARRVLPSAQCQEVKRFVNRIQVVLADDHAILRDGLRALLESEEDMVVVGEAATGLEAIDAARELQPDVVVLDVAMPRLNGVEATRRIKRDLPGCRVLILSQHEEEAYLLAVLQAGADGYVLKRAAGIELAQAIRTVYRGEAALYPAATQVLLKAYRMGSQSAAHQGAEHLTNREREVLVLIAEGMTNTEIAEALQISPKTVDGHRTRLMSKLDVHSAVELTKYAIREQLIQP
jgi:DNA-binding NarL/FixJ family response regulator